MHDIDCVLRRIEEIIKNSSVPEDPVHSRNTLEWLVKLRPDADEALRIAALGHDIERAMEQRKVRRDDHQDYSKFKHAHAANSAAVLVEIMRECGMPEDLTADVASLVRSHETGGGPRACILRDADSISFFDVNLPLYFARCGAVETERRCIWGLKRLSDELKRVVAGFEYTDKKLAAILKGCITGGNNDRHS